MFVRVLEIAGVTTVERVMRALYDGRAGIPDLIHHRVDFRFRAHNYGEGKVCRAWREHRQLAVVGQAFAWWVVTKYVSAATCRSVLMPLSGTKAHTAAMTATATALSIEVKPGLRVSALLRLPSNARACFVFGHGAGAGMAHAFMNDLADALETREIGTLRYNFPYMENGSKRPDPPALCHATIRAAVEEARRQAPTVKLIAGGKSFGGRMTSQAQAAQSLPDVRGLAFVGFPLHPAKKPSTERAAHLTDVKTPMLFLQGTRDELADLTLLEPIVQKLGAGATLKRIEGADHSFHVLARSGRNDRQVMEELADTIASWVNRL